MIWYHYCQAHVQVQSKTWTWVNTKFGLLRPLDLSIQDDIQDYIQDDILKKRISGGRENFEGDVE